MNARTLVWLALAAFALTLIALGLRPPENDPTAPHRVLPTAQAPEGGPIELPVSSTGAALSLDDFHGDYVWVYFGYTSCPDACPVSLAWIAGALARLPPQWQGRVHGLFVSVDPDRDDAERLRDYVAFFDPAIVGATGPQERLREITARYGAFYQYTEVDSALGYVVDHSSSTYLVGPDGALLEVHPHGTTSAQLLEALQAHTGSREEPTQR
ncbi:SCO family protein [Thioalkalivibrio paradoxus]|uniref:Electron transporter SenC n=1 Tax=Thioalkalivibrio paradoxus ARh 1 TaxID=713585 RepID=W0DMD9_9GAMM|nr:SCO family protein [Thioalkalivibrio paradoxus]AHE99734.1 electron transporter SenC [Thioalkalivibrio paradoxus ARh 1]